MTPDYSVAWIIGEQFLAQRKEIKSRRMSVEKTGKEVQIKQKLTKDERKKGLITLEYRGCRSQQKRATREFETVPYALLLEDVDVQAYL